MANTKIPKELSSTPSIVDNGNATAITIDTSENVTLASGLDVNGVVDLNNLTVNTAQGTDGQVLTSTGSGIAWEDASGGGGGGSGVLSGGVKVSLHNGFANQTITRNTTTKIDFDYVHFGNSNNAFSTTNNTYTVPAAGKYLFLGRIKSENFQTSANGQQIGNVYIYKNGSALPNYSTSQYSRTVSTDIIRFEIVVNNVWDLAQNDVIDFRFNLSNYASTTNVDLSGNGEYTTNNYMYIVRIE